MQTSTVETVKSTCGGCHNMCPILVDVQDNKVLRTYGVPGEPRTSGALCSKGQAGPQIAHDPRRLLYPMRRSGARGSGSFERVSWDEAISELATKITEASEQYGPTSVSFFRGQACGWGFTYGMLQRLCHCIGTEPGCGASECFVPRAVAEAISYGGMAHPHGYDKVDLMIFWGKQPAFSYAPSLRKIYDARDRGAKLVCIDPLQFHLGANADQYIRVEPATDLALALGMIYVIVDKGLWDRDFVNAYSNDPGLVRLSAHIKGDNKLGIAYTPEWAESICGVPAKVIRDLAVEYATTEHAQIFPGHGLEGHINVTQTTRSIAILRMITGHLDAGEGCDNLIPPAPPRNPDFTFIDRMVPGYKPDKPAGLFAVPPYNPEESRYPLLFSGQGLLSTPDVLRLMHEGKTRVSIIQGANPMVTMPQPDVVQAALENVDYIAVLDPYLTETAQFADLVLPVGTYLERTEPEWFKSDLRFPKVTLRQKTVQVGEARPDTEIVIMLGQALGYTEEFPTLDVTWYINEDLKPSNISYDDLLANPHGIPFGDIAYRKYEKHGFNTVDGKAQIYCDKLAELDFDPLPNWEDGSESRRNKPELVEEFPFIIFTGRTGPMYVHEQRHTIPWLRELRPEGRVMIHPETARSLDIEDNDWTVISSPRGTIEIKAEVTPIIAKDVLYVPGGWVDSNYNVLGIDEDLDPISSQANYMTCLGNIKKQRRA